MSTEITFKVPQEPCPLPSLDTDEESFVVLGQYQCGSDLNSEEYPSYPVHVSAIADAKKILQDALESVENQQNVKTESDGDNTNVFAQEPTKMDVSTLPTLPTIEKDFESTTNAISIASFTTDMSSEDVQNKVAQIIDENTDLKETILQNNMSLKSHYEKIKAWHEEVQRVHQTYKEKLTQAKAFIDNLKEEKENLVKEVDKVADEKNQLETQIINLKRNLKEENSTKNEVLIQRSDDNIKEFQLDVANKKIKDLETENGELKKVYDATLKRVVKLQEDLEKCRETGQALFLEADKVKYLEALVQEAQKRNGELINEKKKYAEDLDETKKTAYGVMDHLKHHIEILEYEKKQLGVDSQKIKGLEAEIEKLTITNEKYTKENSAMRDDETEIKRLKELSDDLAHKYEAARNIVSALRQELTNQSKVENDLKLTVDSLRAQLEAGNSSEELSNLRTQLTRTQTSLTQVEYARQHAYVTVNQLTEELSLLRAQVKQNDEVCALKMQLDVYKTDFEEERHAREVIKGEKDRLEEDIHNLQRRNQQLQEEIEMLRGERDFVMYPPRQQPSRSATSSSSDSSIYKCPKCDMAFNTLSKLETHVYRCIELDGHLP